MTLFARFRSASQVPRFRSSERDRATDDERTKRVRTAVEEAIAAIEREEDGVKRRLEEASNRAAAIAGTDVDSYLQRDPAEEKLLSDAEREMMRASQRLRELRERHLFFTRMLETLDNASKVPTGG